MRVAIVTGMPVGAAGAALADIKTAKGVELACVIFADNRGYRRNRKKLLKKVWKIGLLGALNGLRLRNWYEHHGGKDIRTEAAEHGIPLVTVPTVNSPECVQALKDYRIDLAVSLGNGYIASRVFTTPREGFINYHGELLPEYPGALSIIWPIYFGLRKTGFTIHRVDRVIDTGAILLRREFDIRFRPRLEETVRATGAVIHPEMPRALREVLENWSAYRDSARPQKPARHFTTPSFWQFAKMMLNNRRLYRQSRQREQA